MFKPNPTSGSGKDLHKSSVPPPLFTSRRCRSWPAKLISHLLKICPPPPPPHPDTEAEQIMLVSMGGWADGQAWADLGARTPIGLPRKSSLASILSKFWSERSACDQRSNLGRPLFYFCMSNHLPVCLPALSIVKATSTEAKIYSTELQRQSQFNWTVK